MAGKAQGWMEPAAWTIAGILGSVAIYCWSLGNAVWVSISTATTTLSFGLAIYFHNRNDPARRNARHIKMLGTFLAEAHELTERLGGNPLPIREYHAWAARASDYLSKHLGDDYALRFRDFSGMVFYCDGSDRSKIRRALDGRCRRLNEFLAELHR
jgi:hypothetical protein